MSEYCIRLSDKMKYFAKTQKDTIADNFSMGYMVHIKINKYLDHQVFHFCQTYEYLAAATRCFTATIQGLVYPYRPENTDQRAWQTAVLLIIPAV